MPIFSKTESKVRAVFMQNKSSTLNYHPVRYSKIRDNKLSPELIVKKMKKWINKLPFYNTTNVVLFYHNSNAGANDSLIEKFKV